MLIRELEEQGNWLFRYRSYVPLVLLPLGVAALALHRHFLADSPHAELAYELGCFLVSLAGLFVRGLTLGQAQPGSSGRNTREQIAEHLNTRGIYSIVRHPLYLGNILMILGVLLFTKSPLLTVAGVLFYLLVYERIIAAEERFLYGKFGEPFREWAARTPALWPRFSQWQPTDYPFSWRAAIKGEFYGFTATVGVMLLMNALKTLFITGRIGAHPVWIGLFVFALVMFFVLRHLRKHTRLFEPARDSEPAR